MKALEDFQLSDELYGAGHTRVCRAVWRADGRPVVLKILSGENIQPDVFAQYQREYEITGSLSDVPGVIKVFGLENVGDSLMIVEEDIGGISLAEILASGKLGLAEGLDVAVRLSHILGEVHRRQIIHKDCNPTNIIWNRRSNELRLIDFGISSQLSLERQEFQSLKQLECNLAYASPEQTGRVNRGLDNRSDLYSLGVTLYQIFTGRLPFVAREGIELVHAHIALMPPPPEEINPEIPPVLSRIIMRLMAKMADDRYQSAWGLEHDLRRCLGEMLQTGRVSDFPLGEKDVSARLRIPQKLYGREAEIAGIVGAFDRAAGGGTELLLVSGSSGTGKSALVHEVHKPLTERHGTFVAGKFDQYQRDMPFHAWQMAFEEFCSLLLKEDEESLAFWRARIAGALGGIGKVIADIVPSIELIIGEQPPVPPLSGEQALNRLNYVFGRFIEAVCREEFPLVVFIDDWQWADAGSLALLKSVMANKDIRHLLLIGAYRDNEVDPSHPFALAIDEIRRGKVEIETIKVSELREEDVHALLADTLGDPPELGTIARLIHEKTRGNAFFTVQLLTDLYASSVLSFSPEERHWVWRSEDIQSRNIADNVVDLMTARIRRLPEGAQRSLIHAACIGDRFELATLAAILDKPSHEAADDLESALMEGILLPIGLNYRVARQKNNTANVYYQFIHDRVRQAAYGMMDKAESRRLHYGIACKWLAELPPEEQEQHIFDIANQYNAGRELVVDDERKRQLVAINLKAGKRAKSATAYSTALHYFQAALELKTVGCWKTQSEQTAELYILAAEVAFLTKDYASMEAWLKEFLAHRHSPLDRASAYKIKLQAFVAQNRLSEAVDAALHGLSLLGIHLPKRPTQLQVMAKLLQTKLVLKGKSLADLHALPAMTDPARLMVMELLGLTIPPAYWTSQELVALTVFQMVRESVAHGYSPNAGYGYSWWGITESAMLGNIDAGCEFGEFAIDLAKRHGLNLQQPLFFAAWIIRKFKHPLKETIPVFEEAYALSMEKGDFEYASYARNNYVQTLFHTGKNLQALLPEMDQAQIDLERFQIGSSIYWHSIWHQTVINLIEPAAHPDLLEGRGYSEQRSLPQHLKVNDASTLFLLYCAKLLLCAFFADRDGMLANAAKARIYLKGGVGMHAHALFHFYESLALLANIGNCGFFKRRLAMRKVAANQKQLGKWAGHAPMNYRHHWLLIEAERFRVNGAFEQAMRHYDMAIDQARKSGFIHEEALASELVGRWLAGRRQDRLAAFYLRQALQLYERWGALAKSARMMTEFSDLLLTGALTAEPGSTGGVFPHSRSGRSSGKIRTQSFDILAVTEASQAISREIVIDRMLKILLKIVIEHSGAQRALLILRRGEDFIVQAKGVAGHSVEIEVTEIPVSDRLDLPLPRSMIQYVGRTAKSLVIPDARHENLFSRDPYMQRAKPISVLCEPIVHQGKLIGMLYLENNLTADAFTEERLELLRLLSSQAAISIENANLYAEMEARVRERTQELAESLETVRIKSGQVKALLDNSGQGFLAFGMGLVVGQEYSQACLTFFGKSPAGQTIDALLFPDDERTRETVRTCLEAALDEEDAERRSLYLSLLPEEINIGGKVLKAEFKPLGRAIMAVLTDITGEKELAAQVAREKTRLEMIVSAVTSGNDFFEAVAEFDGFVRNGARPWARRDRSALILFVHTFKGTFNQLGFHHVPAALHEAETEIRNLDKEAGAAELAELVFAHDWSRMLEEDLKTVTSALGEDFMARRGVVIVPPDQARRFELFAKGLLPGDDEPGVLRELAEIRNVSMRQALADYGKLVSQLAARLEKSVAPLRITGDDVRIDPEIFGPLLRSLGHVFRNAVDHGIEDPDTRFLAGKSEVGVISCGIKSSGGTVIIEISDDGAGIDVEKLKKRASSLATAGMEDWSLSGLVFAEGISSSDDATEISGRGIGMPAVKAEVEELGGKIEVSSVPGRGTTFRISVPLPSVELKKR